MKAQETKDVKLWQSLKNGDKTALSIIFQQHYPSLHQYGFKLSGNSALVEDCLQELFIYIYERRTSFGEVRYIRSYLFQSFRRRMFRALRNERRTVYISLEESWVVMPNELEAIHSDEEQRKILAELVNGLPPRQREMIYLRYYNDLSPQEISDMLSVSYRGVINTLYKAMVKLRKDKDRLRNKSSI